MRALHVHSGNLYGGIETLLATLARHKSACPDLEPHFALCFDGRLGRELRRTDAPVHALGPVRLSRPVSVWRARRRLRQLVDTLAVDVCVFHSAWSLAALSVPVRKARVPVVLWAHDPVDLGPWLQRLAWKIPPDFVICNSAFTRGTLRAHVHDIPAATLLYPVEPAEPIGASQREEIRHVMGVPERCTVIAHVARLDPWKGHSFLLEAAGLIRDLPDWQLWEIGAPQRRLEEKYLEDLKALVARLGLKERVRFLGERTDVASLLGAADIYCHPNKVPEPFGIAVVEALNAGLPVVATAAGGVKDIVDSSCGRLVPPGAPDELAKALGELVLDRALRHEMGSRSRQRADALCNPRRQMAALFEVLSALTRQSDVETPQILGPAVRRVSASGDLN